MSFFWHFKLPQFLKKQQSSAESIANVKVFDCNALHVKKRLDQVAFGDVYTTEYGTEENVKTVVVKKMLHVLDQGKKKLFFKEVALLNRLLHVYQIKKFILFHTIYKIKLFERKTNI